MTYSDEFMRQHDEMCQIVGSVVFTLAAAGHETHRQNIATVLRNEMTDTAKWEPDQGVYMRLAIEWLEKG